MDYKIRIVRYLYYFSLTGLLVLYLFPGSLIGYFFYGDFSQQPDMIPNPMGTSINHALAFFYLSILGLISYMRGDGFNQTIIFLLIPESLFPLQRLMLQHYPYLIFFNDYAVSLIIHFKNSEFPPLISKKITHGTS